MFFKRTQPPLPPLKFISLPQINATALGVKSWPHTFPQSFLISRKSLEQFPLLWKRGIPKFIAFIFIKFLSFPFLVSPFLNLPHVDKHFSMSLQQRRGEKGGGETGGKRETIFLSCDLCLYCRNRNQQHCSLKLAQFFKSSQIIQTLDVL